MRYFRFVCYIMSMYESTCGYDDFLLRCVSSNGKYTRSKAQKLYNIHNLALELRLTISFSPTLVLTL